MAWKTLIFVIAFEREENASESSRKPDVITKEGEVSLLDPEWGSATAYRVSFDSLEEAGDRR